MRDARRDLDVRDMPEPEIRARCEALAPGEAVVMIFAERPDALFEELQADFSGRFEWSHLEAGPERTQIELRRRKTEVPRSVTGYLRADHERLDAIVPEVERLVSAGSFPEARARFATFACGLDWHIEVEEQVLFPTFEAKTGMTRGPTTVMRVEHVDIRASMRRVTSALAAGDASATNEALGELVALLSVHNRKEERMLYPMTDNSLSGPEAQEKLVRRIERF